MANIYDVTELSFPFHVLKPHEALLKGSHFTPPYQFQDLLNFAWMTIIDSNGAGS